MSTDRMSTDRAFTENVVEEVDGAIGELGDDFLASKIATRDRRDGSAVQDKKDAQEKAPPAYLRRK